MFSVNDVRQLVAERPGVSLRDLALHFKVSPPLMEMMCERLVERGDLEVVLQPSGCCGGECGCAGGPKGYRLTLRAIAAMRSKQ